VTKYHVIGFSLCFAPFQLFPDFFHVKFKTKSKNSEEIMSETVDNTRTVFNSNPDKFANFLLRLSEDCDFAARFKTDPKSVMTEARLSPVEMEAMRSRNVNIIRALLPNYELDIDVTVVVVVTPLPM
jgi:hypothetical protein